MSSIIDLLTAKLWEHQQARPEEPNERYPTWCHDQFEAWQREDNALRLLLGIQLVERSLEEKEDA